jgi:hypothetical protein
MLSVGARKISLRCFLASPRSTFLLSPLRADQNLFDLIPAGSGFLTIAKSHPIFSQYWENNYSNDQEFCHGVLVFTATYEKLNMPTAILLFG